MRILYNQKTHSYYYGKFIAIPYKHHVYVASWLVSVYKGNENKEIIMVGAPTARDAAIYAIKAMPAHMKETALVTRLINTNGRGYYLKGKKKAEPSQNQKGALHEKGELDLQPGGGRVHDLPHREKAPVKGFKRTKKASESSAQD